MFYLIFIFSYFSYITELDDSPTVEVISNGPTTNTYVPAPSSTSKYPTHSVVSQGNGDSNHYDVTLPNTTVSVSLSESEPRVEVKPQLKVGENKGAKEKSPSPQPQRQHHSSHHHSNRQRAHSGL